MTRKIPNENSKISDPVTYDIPIKTRSRFRYSTQKMNNETLVFDKEQEILENCNKGK